MQTLCEHCVFAIRDANHEQIGCEFNRLNQLPNRKEGLNYIIDDFCSTCRNIYWAGNRSSYEMQQAVIQEVVSTYTIIVNCVDVHNPDVSKYVNLLGEIKVSSESISKLPDNIYFLCSPDSYDHILSQISGHTQLILTCCFDKAESVIATIADSCKSQYLFFTDVTVENRIEYSDIRDIISSSVQLSKPVIIHTNDEYFCCITKLYQQHSREANPFKSVIEAINGSSSNSQPQS